MPRITAPIRVLVPESGAITSSFKIVVFNSGNASLPFEIAVTEKTGAVTLPIEIQTVGQGSISLPIKTSVYGSPTQPGCGWSASVRLASIDVSARLVGEISVSATENAARIATFSLKPFAGSVDPNKWTGKSVEIDYVEADGIGRRIFTGFVDLPTFDATRRITRFDCSDLLQSALESATRTQIDGIVGGFWSPFAFDENADGWQYAQDRLSTIPKTLDLDRFRTPKSATFFSKSQSDYSFSASNVLNESISAELTSRRNLVNQIDLKLDYRFMRQWQKERRYSWFLGRTLCQVLRTEGSTLPNKVMIQTAISQTGWVAKTINYTGPPASQPVRCPGSNTVSYWSISDELRNYLVWSTNFVLAKRWLQTISEKYEIKVVAPQSKNELGEIKTESRAGFQSDADDSFTARNTYEPATGFDEYSPGVYFFDDDERDKAQSAILSYVGKSRKQILETHRQNTVTFQTPIVPDLERTHTVRVETDAVTSQGKVRSVVHSLNFDAGTALTEISIAVSRGLTDETVVDSGTVLPEKPTPEYSKSESYNKRLASQWGGRWTSGPEQEIEGYTGNYNPIWPGSIIYSLNFAVNVPSISDDYTQNLDLVKASENFVQIPNDELILAA